MTALEMQVSFEIESGKIDSLDKPLTIDIEYWLNLAQIVFVKNRYSGHNIIKEGFEQSQSRIADLNTLIVTESISTVTGLDYKLNDYYAVLPVDYMFVVAEDTTIRYLNVLTNQYVTKLQGVTQTTQDKFRYMLENPLSPHKLHYQEAKPLRLFIGDNVQLISDGNYSIPTYHVTYIRLPRNISIFNSIDCELFEQNHSEIVSLAVNLYLENIGDKRFQTQTVELEKTAEI
jgi:hypothetical protein